MTLNDPRTLARHVAQQCYPRAAEADRLGKMPPEDILALQESGYLHLSLPKEYGGFGLSLHDCVAAQLELSQGNASTALVAGMHLHFFGHLSETRPWDEGQFARWCAIAATGGLFNSVASEPALGSPSRGAFYSTTAQADGDSWLINGRKTWTTGGQFLTHLAVKLALESETAVIIVPGKAQGLVWTESWGDSLSLRASESHDVTFDHVRVPQDHLVERGKREDSPNAWFPMMMAAVYLGVALATRSSLIQFALERVPTALGKPIATLPKIQRQIGEVDLALQAAQTLLLNAARAWQQADQRAALYPRIVAAKHLAVETANRVTEQALQIAGGISLTRDLPLERYFRDTRAGLMQPPSGDTALEIIGQAALARVNSDTI